MLEVRLECEGVRGDNSGRVRMKLGEKGRLQINGFLLLERERENVQ